MKLLDKDINVGDTVVVCESGYPNELWPVTVVKEDSFLVEDAGAFDYEGKALYVPELYVKWED